MEEQAEYTTGTEGVDQPSGGANVNRPPEDRGEWPYDVELNAARIARWDGEAFSRLEKVEVRTEPILFRIRRGPASDTVEIRFNADEPEAQDELPIAKMDELELEALRAQKDALRLTIYTAHALIIGDHVSEATDLLARTLALERIP